MKKTMMFACLAAMALPAPARSAPMTWDSVTYANPAWKAKCYMDRFAYWRVNLSRYGYRNDFGWPNVTSNLAGPDARGVWTFTAWSAGTLLMRVRIWRHSIVDGNEYTSTEGWSLDSDWRRMGSSLGFDCS